MDYEQLFVFDGKIENCPCCGGKAEICWTSLPDSYSDYQQISCTECELSMPLFENGKPVGIEKWNRRIAGA